MSTALRGDPTSQLVGWAVDHYRRTQVDEQVGLVRHLLLDHLANVFGGLPADSSQVLRDFVRSRPGPCRTVSSIDTIEEYAALLTGASAHALEYDDTHQPSSSHPGSAVFPAALVVGAAAGASFQQVAAAIIAGYEVACRVGEAATARGQYERGFHPTGTSGVFGTAIAAGLLAGLDHTQLVSALGIGLAVSSGSMAFLVDGSWTKRIHPGWAAHSGIVATRLAAGGFFGPQDPLTGRDGFLHSHSLSAEPALLTAGLGSGPLAIERTSVKAHACCRYMQAPIDGILRLVDEHRLTPSDIARIDIGVLDAGWDIVVVPAEQKVRPGSIVDAQFSMPFGAAAAVLYGRVGVSESTPEQLRSTALHELMDRVQCHRSPQLEELFPATWAAEVSITCRDGRTVDAFVRSPKGDPENPLSADEMASKFRALAASVLSTGDQDRVIRCVEELDLSQPIGDLQDVVADVAVEIERGAQVG